MTARLLKLRAKRQILLVKIHIIDRQIAQLARREGLTVSQLLNLTHK